MRRSQAERQRDAAGGDVLAEAHSAPPPPIYEIAVIVPVLQRPHRVVPLLENLRAAESLVSYRPVFVATHGDRGEMGALRAAGADFIETRFPAGRGDWARKINLAYQETTEPFLLLAADDLRFWPGWADRALACADKGAGVVGTNDLGNQNVIRGDFSTHPLVRRAYVDEHGTIDEPGKVLHEGYDHNYPDRELAETAKARGAWAFCPDAHVEHLHPHWGKGRHDQVYEKGIRQFSQDRQLFQRRSRLWARSAR